ncbi:hypothetical protein [Microcoleus sp. LEGE 07076]|uniref:hypothetical protein n=1 Tax=Microcoleus sp. LEGE 07076 TaxID=915322 RepID=UPI001D13F0E8|nr:hypothetical protein [Microcoleus sp. LEGE 07076]
MNFRIEFSSSARDSLVNLQELDVKKYNQVLKTLGLMATNLRHPSLKTHKYLALMKRKYLRSTSKTRPQQHFEFSGIMGPEKV